MARSTDAVFVFTQFLIAVRRIAAIAVLELSVELAVLSRTYMYLHGRLCA